MPYVATKVQKIKHMFVVKRMEPILDMLLPDIDYLVFMCFSRRLLKYAKAHNKQKFNQQKSI